MTLQFQLTDQTPVATTQFTQTPVSYLLAKQITLERKSSTTSDNSVFHPYVARITTPKISTSKLEESPLSFCRKLRKFLTITEEVSTFLCDSELKVQLFFFIFGTKKRDFFICKGEKMDALYDDPVLIRQSEVEGEPSVITVNCPDKTGLGCDLCRIIFFFGLTVVRMDVSTDGKWCYIVFWVVGKTNTICGLLKKRLMGACPCWSLASGISYYRAELQSPKPPDVFLLKFSCHDRRGLLHDVTRVLCELELTIKRVKVSTTPDGKVMDLFFVTDTRELLHTKKRKEETYDYLKDVVGDAMISCDIERVGSEITACSQEPSFFTDTFTEDMFILDRVGHYNQDDSSAFRCPSITMDNSLSPAHTLVQIVCRDHKGLLYDVMRTLKDHNIQISYGRFTPKGKSECEVELFTMQGDGKKIVDPSKQSALCSRLEMELSHPVRVAFISRGPDTELLVANPVELSGKGRPLVFYDITLALKKLNRPIFLAEIGMYMIGDREWEVYRVLLDEGDGSPYSKKAVEETVWKMLMSWE